MTPAEKSEELINKFYELRGYGTTTPAGKAIAKGLAQQCAIICVEQIIDTLEAFGYTGTFYDHFETGKMVTTEQASPTEYYRAVLEHIKNS